MRPKHTAACLLDAKRRPGLSSSLQGIARPRSGKALQPIEVSGSSKEQLDVARYAGALEDGQTDDDSVH
jgi:hypothetical protein